MPVEFTQYTTLSLQDVATGLEDAAVQTQAFAGLSALQLNWKPEPTRWSVGQCLDHLLTTNRLMLEAADSRLAAGGPQSLWQRVPMLPSLFGRMLIHSQAPTTTRKFTATANAQPAASDLTMDVVPRLIDQQRAAIAAALSLDERVAAAAIMTSPFAPIAIYTVLDGWRIMLAHNHRHLQQARGVIAMPGFPKA